MHKTVFIDGAKGTTGLQIRNRLIGRQDIRIISLAPEERYDRGRRQECILAADLVILCLPDDAAREAVEIAKKKPSIKIIDTSTAHRTNPDWVYGFVELTKEQKSKIQEAKYVSNPGCYAVAAISILRPLREKNILGSESLVTINGVSGYSGGGKQLIRRMEDSQQPDAIDFPYFAYSLQLNHKHLPEISTYGQLHNKPIFTPNVGRFARGMLVNIPLHFKQLEKKIQRRDLIEILKEYYSNQPNIVIADEEENSHLERIHPQELNYTDKLKIYVFADNDSRMINLCSVLDNLGKGASGSAVQNLNLMLNT